MDEKDVEKFQTLFKERFGYELATEDATRYANRFLRLMELVYTPMRIEDAKLVEERLAALNASPK